MFETKTIMTTDIIAVKRHTPIIRVVEIMVENNITGLPVVNDDMTIAGIISEKDVLYLLSDPKNDSAKVEDFIAICECLVNSNFRRVPITADGKLVGIISRRDIIKYIIEPL